MQNQDNYLLEIIGSYKRTFIHVEQGQNLRCSLIVQLLENEAWMFDMNAALE